MSQVDYYEMQEQHFNKPISAHIFNETHFDRCMKCGLTKEQCEDGYSCGKVQCTECTLIRHCIGGQCEECRNYQEEERMK